jgi:hypothetical protein
VAGLAPARLVPCSAHKKTASPKEFSDWLFRQSNIIVELAELEN